MVENNDIIKIIIFIENRRRTRGGGKMKYEKPEFEILLFETTDVIKTSPGQNSPGTDVGGWN